MITRGFARGEITKPSRKRYLKEVYHVEEETPNLPTISFAKEAQGIVLEHDDPVVITMILTNANLHRTLVDQGSSADILFKPGFDKLGLEEKELKSYPDTLFGLGDTPIRPLGFISLYTTFGKGLKSKTLNIDYIVVDVASAYDVLIGRTTLNRLGAVVSTPHLCMKFPTQDGIATIKGDQRLENSNLFAWKAVDMPGIDPGLMMHKLAVYSSSRPVQQRRRKLGPERAQVVKEQVQALLEAEFVREVKYPTWCHISKVDVQDVRTPTLET
ncbi:uncharacterized protein LOC107627394 [Arachis ipaensis]|uniref:uncharacterized protein LOC107627394 n=1 Tax=Arachis ipaensis TaxID=130454 RepID=UPI0007AF3946|nr:uncharacterized protein LOC107627394 [Arachis ipaensis]XP_025636078.1 uncharacterized protein LOC112730195 [Arachis hypogaea]